MEAPLQRRAAKGTSQKVTRRRPQLPLKIVDRYLFHFVAEATFRGLFWFAGLLFMFAVITVMRKAIGNPISLGMMLQLAVLYLPRIITFSLPMSILFGTVQTFSDLSGRGEVTALYAGGMSLPRMVWAPLGWGAMLALIAFFLQEAVVPSCELQRDNLLSQGSQQALAGKQFTFMDPPPGSGPLKRIIQADSFDPKTSTLHGPVIQIFNPDHSIALQIEAERGQWDFGSGDWVFHNGKSIMFPKDQDVGGSITSDFTTIEGRQVAKRDLAPSPRMLGQATTRQRDALERRKFEMVSVSDLMRYRETLRVRLQAAMAAGEIKEIGNRIDGATFGIHDKIATPLICLVLVLAGAPLGLRPQRSSGGFAMGMSLIVLLIYYVIWTWAGTLGKAGHGNPYVMAYLAPGMAAIVGLVLLWKKSR